MDISNIIQRLRDLQLEQNELFNKLHSHFQACHFNNDSRGNNTSTTKNRHIELQDPLTVC